MSTKTEIATSSDVRGSIMEGLVLKGDLATLSPGERLEYYARVCESLGLNPLTQPFGYIELDGKLTLYARREATEQLRKLHGVSCLIKSQERHDDVYIVTVETTDSAGRRDFATGVVDIKNRSGKDLANAMMRAETKAKRRATLSIVGLGMLDDAERDTLSDAVVNQVDMSTGEIIGSSDEAHHKGVIDVRSPQKERKELAPRDLQDALKSKAEKYKIGHVPDDLDYISIYAMVESGFEKAGIDEDEYVDYIRPFLKGAFGNTIDSFDDLSHSEWASLSAWLSNDGDIAVREIEAWIYWFRATDAAKSA